MKKYDLDKITKKAKEMKEEKEYDFKEELESLDKEDCSDCECEDCECDYSKNEPDEDIIDFSPDSIALYDREVFDIKMVNMQMNMFKLKMDNLELQKQLLLNDRDKIIENFENIKKEIAKKHGITYDDYVLNLAESIMVKKPQ